MKELTALAITILLVSGCANQSPAPRDDIASNLLGQHYYECPKCQSLDGGYYGKGSVSSWRSETGPHCRHCWQEIPQADFKARWQERAGNATHY